MDMQIKGLYPFIIAATVLAIDSSVPSFSYFLEAKSLLPQYKALCFLLVSLLQSLPPFDCRKVQLSLWSPMLFVGLAACICVGES